MNYSSIQQPFVRTITVTGNGKVQVTPNIAQIQFDVVTEGNDLHVVQQQNSQISTRVIEAIVRFGIQRKDIQTSFYQIVPKYDYIDGKQTFRGYEVRNSIHVTVRDLNKVGQLIDLAIQQGVNQVSSIQFRLENEEIYYNQALQLAIENGTEKGIQIGKEIGVIRLQPIEIVEHSVGGERLMKAVAYSPELVTTPIEPGTILVDAEVKIKFMF